MIDVSYIFGAVIFIWFVRKTIKKEMNILNEIIVIQNDITQEGNKWRNTNKGSYLDSSSNIALCKSREMEINMGVHKIFQKLCKIHSSILQLTSAIWGKGSEAVVE